MTSLHGEGAITYNTRVDVTYGGQVSMDGGAWITMSNTVRERP